MEHYRVEEVPGTSGAMPCVYRSAISCLPHIYRLFFSYHAIITCSIPWVPSNIELHWPSLGDIAVHSSSSDGGVSLLSSSLREVL
jgi:hypothetical protein